MGHKHAQGNLWGWSACPGHTQAHVQNNDGLASTAAASKKASKVQEAGQAAHKLITEHKKVSERGAGVKA